MKTIDLTRFNKSRESIIEAGGYSFTIRRPSVLEVHRAVSNGGSVSIDFAADQVVGWSKVNESDLINGGDPEPLAFDAEVFKAWIADRSDLWQPIVMGVVDAFKRHEEATEARGNA